MKRRKKRKASAGGFTLIEIIAALAVFMIGVMGMVALQGASIHAAVKSRQQTAAVGIARYMITQLKSEVASWNKAQNTGFPTDTYPLLSGVFSTAVNTGQWIQFGGSDGSGAELRLDDYLGHSGLGDGPASRFCVNYMISNLETFAGTVNPWDYTVWLVRVRVSWTKEGFFQEGGIDWNICDPSSVNNRIVTVGSDDVVELVSTATREFAK